MKQKIKFIMFIIIYLFLLLTSIYCLHNDMWVFSKFMDEICKVSGNLDRRNHRSLANCKQDKYSNNVYLKENFRKNGVNKGKDISNNRKGPKGKNKQLNRCLLNKEQYYTEVIDYNNGIFDGKHFHFEKKLIKKKDYDDFLEQSKRVGDIALKKIKLRNYGFGFSIFIIFLLLGIGLPILKGYRLLDNLSNTMPFSFVMFFIVDSVNPVLEKYIYLISFCVLIIIVSIILIITIPKILRNNEKYNKIKLLTE
ncbi:fam-m protein [Plasmodium malariae]|uniref:Fam-m protein n=1 Tax=Plasmodium malariae TaxID=5858 RepID=A0A1D3JJ33_PLAMA|nr:fam-m protein [Plasmodium malariae]SBT86401.1 fam-m protein [Plasmodium malariae]